MLTGGTRVPNFPPDARGLMFTSCVPTTLLIYVSIFLLFTQFSLGDLCNSFWPQSCYLVNPRPGRKISRLERGPAPRGTTALFQTAKTRTEGTVFPNQGETFFSRSAPTLVWQRRPRRCSLLRRHRRGRLYYTIFAITRLPGLFCFCRSGLAFFPPFFRWLVAPLRTVIQHGGKEGAEEGQVSAEEQMAQPDPLYPPLTPFLRVEEFLPGSSSFSTSRKRVMAFLKNTL